MTGAGAATAIGRGVYTRDWLAGQMKKAPKPLAVFAANDQHAVDVLESCNSAGISVPDQVAIVGAENYLLAPDKILIALIRQDAVDR